ncbi:hypothetical protein SKAU_G00364670 [Synaphobranchus kaupii]|uniref:Uncharacterized protein n=1 Tax=Synaphobranchus kaupii TaxID=118154 RepID=A0A9Q1IFD0_SYNKA|nr:hypothetical protein SKAU_G00364670 [Synaphobranchus kaupii]
MRRSTQQKADYNDLVEGRGHRSLREGPDVARAIDRSVPMAIRVLCAIGSKVRPWLFLVTLSIVGRGGIKTD